MFVVELRHSVAIAALALEVPLVVAVTATSSDAEQVRDALVAWLGEREVALWRAGIRTRSTSSPTAGHGDGALAALADW